LYIDDEDETTAHCITQNTVTHCNTLQQGVHGRGGREDERDSLVLSASPISLERMRSRVFVGRTECRGFLWKESDAEGKIERER